MTTDHAASPARRPAPRPPAGVTLVELLVVIAILSLLAGVAAIPASADGGPAALDLAEVQLRDALGTAQTLAYSLGVPHGVVFDPDGERFAVVAVAGALASDPLTHGDYSIDFTRVEQPRGVTIESAVFGTTGTAAIFDGQGVPVQGGQVVLAKGASTRTLALDVATGKLVAP